MSKELSELQEEVLNSLLNLYEREHRIVKSREIAESLGRSEGTVKVVLSHLKSLGLVEAKPGPGGGYVPTAKAYRILYPTSQRRMLLATFRANGSYIRKEVRELAISMMLPDEVKVRMRLKDVSGVKSGVEVIVEGMNGWYLRVEGKVVKLDGNDVEVQAQRILYTPIRFVEEIAKKDLLILSSDMTFKEAVRLLHSKGIRGAPVSDRQGRIIGFLTVTDIALALSQGLSPEERIGGYVRKGVFSISEGESVIDAIKVMNSLGIGRLIVVDRTGKPLGILTRTDIIKSLLEM